MFTYPVSNAVTLELVAPHHAPDLFAAADASRTALAPYLAWVADVQSVEDMRQRIHRHLRGMANGTRWSWVIRVDGSIAGHITLSVTRHQHANIGYWLATGYTGRGIMTRCVRLITEYALTEQNFERVRIHCARENARSCAVAERAGFQYEATLRDANTRDGTFIDYAVYSLLADELTPQYFPYFAYVLSDDADLRLLEDHHAEEHHALTNRNADDLQRWFWWMQNTRTLEWERASIHAQLEKYARGEGMMCGIFFDDDLVGTITLDIDTANHSAQTGYWLDRRYRGGGLVTQAVQVMMAYSFDVLDLQRFFIRVSERNRPSRAVADRLGMHHDATLRDEAWINGRWVTHMVYSMLKSEWQTREDRHS